MGLPDCSSSRSSGNNRRSRKLTSGNRTPWATDVQQASALAETLPPGAKDVAFLTASRLVKVPHTERPGQPLSEYRTQDKAVVRQLQDKIGVTGKHAYWQRVLHSYDKSNTGLISVQDFRNALDRLNVALSEQEKAKVVARVQHPHQPGQVDWRSFLTTFHELQPLGPVSSPNQHGLASSAEVKAPWLQTQWRPRASDWSLHAPALQGIGQRGQEGSHQQMKDDAVLMSFLTERLARSSDKLRLLFRRADPGKTQHISKEGFMAACETLRLEQVGRRQLERVYDLMAGTQAAGGAGSLDYEAFLAAFDRGFNVAKHKAKLPASGASAAALDTVRSVTPAEVAATLRSPAALELQHRLYTKAHCALEVFKTLDVGGTGQLSLEDLTAGCRTLVPELTHKDVAALVAAVDPGGGGGLEYKDFVTRVLDAAPSHLRTLEAELAVRAAAASAGSPGATQALSSSLTEGRAGGLNSTSFSTTAPAPALSATAILAGSGRMARQPVGSITTERGVVLEGGSHMGPPRNGWGHSPLWGRPTTPPSIREQREQALLDAAAAATSSPLNPSSPGSRRRPQPKGNAHVNADSEASPEHQALGGDGGGAHTVAGSGLAPVVEEVLIPHGAGAVPLGGPAPSGSPALPSTPTRPHAGAGGESRSASPTKQQQLQLLTQQGGTGSYNGETTSPRLASASGPEDSVEPGDDRPYSWHYNQAKPQTPSAGYRTQWAADKLPTPGYTGVLPKKLRPAGPQVVSDENRRVRLHGGAVAPIVGSLQWSAEVGAPPDPWASLPSVPTFSEETQVLVDDMATRRSMPSLYTSLPDMARFGSSVKGVGGLLKRSSSTASRSVDLGATGASSASAAHHQRFMPRAASALDTVNPRSSSEGHEGSRRAATVQGLRPTSLAETAAAHDLGSMGAHPGDRFWHLKHPDTRHITGVLPGCSQHADLSETYVRKSDPAYMTYQEQDKARKARHGARAIERYDAAETFLDSHVAAADHLAESTTQFKLTTMGLRKARYLERSAMYEDLRHPVSASAMLHFNRSHFFTDHVIHDPVLARS